MKYNSKLWRKTIIIISLALCLCTNGMAAVCAESAEITTEESSVETEDMQEPERQQEAWSGTVRAIGQKIGRAHV